MSTLISKSKLERFSRIENLDLGVYGYDAQKDLYELRLTNSDFQLVIWVPGFEMRSFLVSKRLAEGE